MTMKTDITPMMSSVAWMASVAMMVAMMVSSLAAATTAATAAGPPRPTFPVSYATMQISECMRESAYCPAGFVNSTIASISYYDWNARKMAAGDVYNLNYAGAYIADQTFVDVYNATHLVTDLYLWMRNSASIVCARYITPGQFISPDPLATATYVGIEQFRGQPCFKFATPSYYWYVSQSSTPSIVGGFTADMSQTSFFVDMRAQRLDPKVWVHPPNVPCVPADDLRARSAEFASILASKPPTCAWVVSSP